MSSESEEVRVLGPDGYEEQGKTAWETLEDSGSTASEEARIERAEDTQQAHTESHDGPVDWYKPPYPPDQLVKLLERSETHAACVQAKSQGVAGFGFDLVPHESADSQAEGQEPPGFDKVNEFWNSPQSTFQLGPDKQSATPVGVLEHGWDDLESTGWLAIEILCNTQTGEPTGLAHIPAHTIRVRKDAPGFVQIDSAGLPVKFFGKAGDRYGEDKTFIDPDDGTVSDSVRGVNTVANELLVIRNYSAIAPHYGLPDVIPALQTIAGDVAARQYNSKFFENDGVPRFAVIVEGGELTEKAWDELRETFQNMTVEDNAHRGVLLEAVSTTASEYGEKENVNIRIEPLTVGVDEDASFTEYRDANEHDILQAHSVPPVEAERTEDSNYANAREQRRKFAQGTLRPKQETFAARLYNIIHVQGLEVPEWTLNFHLHGGENKQREAEIAQTRIEASQGAMTVNEARQELGYDPLEGSEGEMLLASIMYQSRGMGGFGGGGSEEPEAAEAFESGRSQQRAEDHGYSITERSDFEPEKPSVRSIPGAQTPGEQQAERASTEKGTQYSEGSVVEYDSDGHLGAVVAVMTDSFTVPVGDEDDEEVDASSDNPKYIVARETQGFGVFEGSDLKGGEFPDNPGTPSDLSDAEADESYRELAADIDSHSALAGEALRAVERETNVGIGWDSYPPTWRKSSIPNRVILLDVWTSMGATFTGCVRHMRDDMATPKDFCAATKDEVLGTTRWRNRF